MGLTCICILYVPWIRHPPVCDLPPLCPISLPTAATASRGGETLLTEHMPGTVVEIYIRCLKL